MRGAVPLLSLYNLMAWSGKTLPILRLYITYLLRYRSVRITWHQEMRVLAYREVVTTLWTLQHVTHCENSWTASSSRTEENCAFGSVSFRIVRTSGHEYNPH